MGGAGEPAECTGDLAESAGLVSLVCREAVRLLVEVGFDLERLHFFDAETETNLRT